MSIPRKAEKTRAKQCEEEKGGRNRMYIAPKRLQQHVICRNTRYVSVNSIKVVREAVSILQRDRGESAK